MAYEENLKCITLRAPSTAYSTYQYHLVKASTVEGYWAAGTTKPTGEKVSRGAVGVLQDAPTVTGEPCAVAPMGSGGISKVICGSTKLRPGYHFVMGAAGRAQSTASAVAQDIVYGPWLATASSTDTIGQALLNIVGITT